MSHLAGVRDAWHRITMTYAANVLTLTPKAPCIIGVPSSTAGAWIPAKFGTVVTANDAGHGSPNLSLGLLGTTNSVAWGSAAPLLLGAMNDPESSGDVAFLLTRNSRDTTTPASANNIACLGSVAATSSQNNICVLKTGITKASWQSLPYRIVGSLTATRSSAAEETTGSTWTIGALTAADGFGQFQEGVQFTFPSGQDGNESGKYTYVDGASTLAFASATSVYHVRRDGWIDYELALSNATAGGEATAVRWYMPYSSARGASYHDIGHVYIQGGVTNIEFGVLYDSVTYFNFMHPLSLGDANAILANEFLTGASTSFTTRCSFPAF